MPEIIKVNGKNKIEHTCDCGAVRLLPCDRNGKVRNTTGLCEKCSRKANNFIVRGR